MVKDESNRVVLSAGCTSESPEGVGNILMPEPHHQRFSLNGSEVRLGLWYFYDSVIRSGLRDHSSDGKSGSLKVETWGFYGTLGKIAWIRIDTHILPA